MGYLVFKYLVTAGLIVVASEIAKRSDRLGALVLALPLTTLLTMVWLFAERQPVEKIANHAWYTFWYGLPTLPMFLFFPWLLQRFGFAGALAAFVAGTALCFVLFALALRRFGISLW